MVNRLTVRGKMYLVIALTLFIVNAQFSWMNIDNIKEIGLWKTEEAINLSHRTEIKVSIDALAAILAESLNR